MTLFWSAAEIVLDRQPSSLQAGREASLFVARRSLSETMSQYLIERIESLPNVDVVVGCEVESLKGSDGTLESVSIRNRSSGDVKTLRARYLFSFIGAEPNTDWLRKPGITLDTRGFVLTGEEVDKNRLPLETSRRGIFAVGDVRSTSVKRVAAAVGDGAQVVASIHKYLAAVELEEVSKSIDCNHGKEFLIDVGHVVRGVRDGAVRFDFRWGLRPQKRSKL